MMIRSTAAFALCIALAHGAPALAANPYGYGNGGQGGGSPHTGRKAASSPYAVTVLASDQAGPAAHVDPHLVNAWGLVAGRGTPWWVADNASNSSTLYDAAGNVIPLVVAVPGSPTGIVFNGGPGFVVRSGNQSGPASFLFATESGQVSGWNVAVPSNPSAEVFTLADRSAVGAVYKGLALAATSAGDRLYAADFHNARIDVFDASGALVTSAAGAFVDRRLPRHFAPFGIQNVGSILFVTYAKQDKDARDDRPGPGLGFVDMFDPAGTLLGRVASRGALNAPWGLAQAPAGFGTFSNDLLVGNFGNGRIHAYTRRPNGRWKLHGTLAGTDGKVLVIDGLWGLSFGDGGLAGPINVLYFTAGPGDETHGAFGSIQTGG